MAKNKKYIGYRRGIMSKIKFNIEDLDYQTRAVESVSNLFNHIEKSAINPIYRDKLNIFRKQYVGTGEFVRNAKISTGEDFLSELRYVQNENTLPLNNELDEEGGTLNLTVDMETGTGKTYVYIRTILDLHFKYNKSFNKFIIVVPSVAIRLGVEKSLDIFKEKFERDFEGIDIRKHTIVYNSDMKDSVEKIRNDFINKNGLSILIINTQAFNSSNNKLRDKDAEHNTLGISAWDEMKYINPIIIIDEPQKFDGSSDKDFTKTMSAIYATEPRFIIRYSATHRKNLNVVYRLDSYDAYLNELVKRIRVKTVKRKIPKDFPYIKFRGITKELNAKIEIINKEVGKEPKIKVFDVNKANGHLLELSGDLRQYSGMRIAENPRADEKILKIDKNGRIIELKEGEEDIPFTENETVRYQMEIAIESHLDQQFKLLDAGKEIKALSLFFIDEVAKVRGEDGEDGEYFKLFDKIYEKVISRDGYKTKFEKYNRYFKDYKNVRAVRQGYFAIDKKQKVAKIDETRLEKENWRKAEREAIANGIELILEKKEELLSFETSLAFIFSHSALREGWDNPNIFTLCTLKKSDNEIAKKQEIGRGLRLPVDIYGKRHKDIEYNVLTVVANSSYDEFSKSLQKSYNEDTGFDKEKLDINAAYEIFQKAGLREEIIDVQLATEFINELKEQGIIYNNNKLKKNISKELENLDFNNEILKPHIIKLKEKFVEVMKGKGSKRIIIENGDEDEIKNTWNSFINEERFREIVFNLKSRLEHKSYYEVKIDDKKFINEAITKINEEFKYRELKEQYLTIDEAKEIRDKVRGFGMQKTDSYDRKIQDKEIKIERTKFEVVDYIMEATDLPRKALGTIYDNIEKKHLFNSQDNLDLGSKVIKSTLINHVRENPIEYELIKGYKLKDIDIFEMDTIVNTELDDAKKYIYPLNPRDKSTEKGINKYYKFDSEGELKFAQRLDKDENIKLFTKLYKGGFVIDTPYGNYTPDWAMVYENDDGKQEFYFIVETKFQKEWEDLSDVEQFKIKCGEAHFEAIDEDEELPIKFKWANSYNNLEEKIKNCINDSIK